MLENEVINKIKNNENINWTYISIYSKPSEDFIEEFYDKVNWACIFMFQNLSEKFIEKNYNKFNINNIDCYHKIYFNSKNKPHLYRNVPNFHNLLHSDFIFNNVVLKEFAIYLNWLNISHYQHLSEDFIERFSDKVNWYYISYSQKLSEDFIIQFSDKVCWNNVSSRQKLSEDFIRKFSDKVNLKNIPLCYFNIEHGNSWKSFI